MGENKSGLIGGLIAGAGGLVIAIILIFVVIATVQDADLLGADSTTSFAVTNETASMNITGDTLSGYNSSNSGFTITALWGVEGGVYNVTIPIANGIISSVGVLTNATIPAYDNVSVSYTYTYTHDNVYKESSDNLAANLTAGVDNVSSKIPTVLLIAAVVLLFGVLAILVVQARKAGMMGGGSGTL